MRPIIEKRKAISRMIKNDKREKKKKRKLEKFRLRYNFQIFIDLCYPFEFRNTKLLSEIRSALRV